MFIDFSMSLLMFIQYMDLQACRYTFVSFPCGCCVSGLKPVIKGKWVLLFLCISPLFHLLLPNHHSMSNMVVCLSPLHLSVNVVYSVCCWHMQVLIIWMFLYLIYWNLFQDISAFFYGIDAQLHDVYSYMSIVKFKDKLA